MPSFRTNCQMLAAGTDEGQRSVNPNNCWYVCVSPLIRLRRGRASVAGQNSSPEPPSPLPHGGRGEGFPWAVRNSARIIEKQHRFCHPHSSIALLRRRLTPSPVGVQSQGTGDSAPVSIIKGNTARFEVPEPCGIAKLFLNDRCMLLSIHHCPAASTTIAERIPAPAVYPRTLSASSGS